jgi:HNH endonuclease
MYKLTIKVSKPTRTFVAVRAKWCCEYCLSQERFSPQHFTLDHFDPSSKGGSNEPENLVYACQGCNGSKHNRIGIFDQVTNDFVPFFNPRKQVWAEHFAWSDDYTRIIGITAIGRVTVLGLQMNRQILIDLRAFLYRLGEHPLSI